MSFHLQMTPAQYSYQFIKVVDWGSAVFNVQLDRPKQLNALHTGIWREISDVFRRLDSDEDCRVVVLTGNGRAFCTGIDLNALANLLPPIDDVARRARGILRELTWMQEAFTLIEKCSKPVIAAVHNYCIGAGLDMLTACDIRVCTSDAQFCVKEAAVAMAADVGTLNRLPKIIGNHSWMRDICFSARVFGADEALKQGLVSDVYKTQGDMLIAVKKQAEVMAAHSPVGVQGTKIVLNYARDFPVDQSLRYVALWNISQLQTEDVPNAAAAIMTKSKPTYSKL